jgi:hypothetical protein
LRILPPGPQSGEHVLCVLLDGVRIARLERISSAIRSSFAGAGGERFVTTG